MMAYPETLKDPSWYLDSGASNHVTTELGKLSLKGTTSHPKSIMVGNGNHVSIANVGIAYLFTPTSKLILKEVYHVPFMKKNLISISKLTYDNEIFVEFHDNDCLIKEKKSRKTLLRGKLEHGLYRIEDNRDASNFLAKTTSSIAARLRSNLHGNNRF